MLKIALVRTASAANRQMVERGVDILKSLVDCTVIGEDTLYRPLTPCDKANILYSYMQDTAVDFIWSVRGGEGTADILPFLTNEASDGFTCDKVFVGSSDFTALLNFVSVKFNGRSIHGPNLVGLSPSAEVTISMLRHILYNKSAQCSYQNILVPLNQLAHSVTNLEFNGSVGGNLSLMLLNKGDLWEVSSEGKLVFLEDWQEKPHVIDRGLKYLCRSGFFKQASAIIFGNFSKDIVVPVETRRLEFEEYLSTRMFSIADGINVPVFKTDMIGHAIENIPIPMWTKGTISKREIVRLEFLQ